MREINMVFGTRQVKRWGLRFALLSALLMVSLEAFAAESSYRVSLDTQALLPASCGSLAGIPRYLPVVLGAFSDKQPTSQVAELIQGDATSPVYLTQPVGGVVREGLSALLSRCGYRVLAKEMVSDRPFVVLSGDVSVFQVNFEKKLITAKGGAELVVSLRLDGPASRHFTFEFRVDSEVKGLRKKGITQIESELANAYRQFLVQVSEYVDFQKAFVKLSETSAE